MDSDELDQLALEKLHFGENLLQEINNFGNLDGITKLQRKINQELKFLKKVYRNKLLKKEHLQCSNLTHFSALINVMEKCENCQSVNKIFMLEDRKVTVDIVCDNGVTWMKVIARNPKSVSRICDGDSSFGVRTVFDHAEEYIECAKLYPCLFQTPKVVFVFVNGIDGNVKQKLESYGIIVQADCANSDLMSENKIGKVNLDVSAMLAYCSSVTNGSAGLYEYSVPVLKQQAAWEVERPQKPILEQFFKNKRLFCCQTAKDNFENIVNTVGGPNEKIRAVELLERITVLPDDATAKDTGEIDENSPIFNKIQYTNDKILPIGGKVKQRSFIIFTFGDRIQAVTVTANDGFVRAARQQGINFVVFVHESRALTEQKEQLRGVKVM